MAGKGADLEEGAGGEVLDPALAPVLAAEAAGDGLGGGGAEEAAADDVQHGEEVEALVLLRVLPLDQLGLEMNPIKHN